MPRGQTKKVIEIRALVERGVKICTKCGLIKTLEEFYKDPRSANGYHSCCNRCWQDAAKTREARDPEANREARRRIGVRARAKNPEKASRHSRASRAKFKYGISLEEYDGAVARFLAEQNWKCAICGKKSVNRSLCLDHSHTTRKLRGLLCTQCNLAIGYVQDSSWLLEKCIGYLRKHQPLVIGIAGHFRAGKDSAASYLVAKHGFVRFGFGDVLRKELKERLCATLIAYADKKYNRHDEGFIEKLLTTAKDEVTRALMQEYGTELRRAEYQDYWVDEWDRHMRKQAFAKVVAPDIRFENELRAIRSMGGVVWLVKRPGYNGDSHESEKFADEYQGWDAVLVNDGTVSDLHQRVEAALASLAR